MPKVWIYPDCEHPEWLVVGAWCYCWGEAQDKFRVMEIKKNSVLLSSYTGHRVHGWESIKKIHREVT